MDETNNKYFKDFLPFIGGFVLGAVSTYYYFLESMVVVEKAHIEIKIVDNNGKTIITDYHYNSSNESIIFKKRLDDVKISLKLGKNHKFTINNYSGHMINVNKLQSNIELPKNEENEQ